MNTTSAAAAPRAPISRAWRRSATPIPAAVCRSSTARPTAAAYPNLCKQSDDDEQGGLTFEADRRRFAVRLTAPYSDERRHAASELAKKTELKGQV